MDRPVRVIAEYEDGATVEWSAELWEHPADALLLELRRVLPYLEHPEVREIPFVVSAEHVAERVREVLALFNARPADPREPVPALSCGHDFDCGCMEVRVPIDAVREALADAIVVLEVLHAERETHWYQTWLAPEYRACIVKAVESMRRVPAALASSVPEQTP